ncbi:MAG: hypothetical protein ACYCXP_12415 [Leptospirillum sp.]
MKILSLQKKPDRSLHGKLTTFLLATLVALSACSGNNNTSSTPIPLPNGQAGSLITSNGNPADCFATTTTSGLSLCSTSSSTAAGTNGGVTALNTFVSASSVPGVVVGASNGVVSVVNSVYSSSPTVVSCPALPSSSSISSISAVAVAGTNIFAAVGNTLYEFYTGASTCTSTSTYTSTPIGSGGSIAINGLGVAPNGTLFGVTNSGSYFSIANASTVTNLSTSSLATPLTPLPNYPVSGPSINGMAIDPNGLVFFADASTNTANNGGQITIYHVSSSNGNTLSPNNVQSYSGNNNGVAMSDPIGIAVSETTVTNSNYCSTAPCDYIYLLNIGNSIQQYVMPVPNPINGGVSINPFNLPYTGCEMTDPAVISSFPSLTSSPFSTQSQKGPFVFLGNTTPSGLESCLNASTYGNNVVSYGIIGQ